MDISLVSEVNEQDVWSAREINVTFPSILSLQHLAGHLSKYGHTNYQYFWGQISPDFPQPHKWVIHNLGRNTESNLFDCIRVCKVETQSQVAFPKNVQTALQTQQIKGKFHNVFCCLFYFYDYSRFMWTTTTSHKIVDN